VSDALSVDRGDGIQVWRMGLAPVNAINDDLLDSFDEALADATKDASIAAVVLSSDLRVFSAGADAKWMAKTASRLTPAGLLEEFNVTMDRFRDVCLRIRRAPFLVVAAVQGHALAGGLELAAACDLRFCAVDDSVQLGVPEMDLFGVLPSGGGGAQYLARLMGPSRALDFILSGKPITPQRAFDLGLVDRLLERADVLDVAVSFATEVASKASRIGVSAAKSSIFGGEELPLASALALDRAVHWDAMRRGNFLSGVEGFIARFGSDSA